MPFGVDTKMNFPFFDDDTTGYIDVNSLSAMFLGKNANSSSITQLCDSIPLQ